MFHVKSFIKIKAHKVTAVAFQIRTAVDLLNLCVQQQPRTSSERHICLPPGYMEYHTRQFHHICPFSMVFWLVTNTPTKRLRKHPRFVSSPPNDLCTTSCFTGSDSSSIGQRNLDKNGVSAQRGVELEGLFHHCVMKIQVMTSSTQGGVTILRQRKKPGVIIVSNITALLSSAILCNFISKVVALQNLILAIYILYTHQKPGAFFCKPKYQPKE